MESTRERNWKHAWARRLANHTLLRMLVLNFWFRLVVILFVLGGLGLAVGLPKMWRTTPAGIRPIVKVSLIDLVQVRVLRNSARKLAAQGKELEALRAWRSALANNQADTAVLREYLNQVIATAEPDRVTAFEALNSAAWLLRLTGTNRADVGLAARVFGKFEVYGEAYRLLSQLKDELSPEAQAVYLATLFRTGRLNEFGEHWERWGEKFAGDPALSLYHAVHLAGFGAGGKAAEARERVRTAKNDLKNRNLALRLELIVCREKQDAEGFAAALQELEASNAASLDDRIDHWLLLKNSGKLDEAKKLADSYAAQPRTPFELMRLASAYGDLGLTERAIAVLDRYAPDLANADAPWAWDIWSNYAALLIESRDWNALKAMALRLRMLSRAGRSLAGFTYFMEGRALHSLNQRVEALDVFRTAAKLGFPDASFAMRAGIDLLRMGYPDVAWDVLKPLEKTLAANVDYWFAMSDAAQMLKRDAAALLRVTARAYELQPNSFRAIYNYASALIMNRQKPAEAARLTLTALARDTNSISSRLLHSAALALNRRYAEADEMLKSVPVSKVAGPAMSFYFYTALEIHMGLEDYDRARVDIGKIDAQHLFPTQAAWVERTRRQLARAN
ncbi:MAG: hypothetical protein QHJ82_05865 [Verrucomicrobiota bacterium]|nr:hypothetical protein [Verrucomicrobiota bacterium]